MMASTLLVSGDTSDGDTLAESESLSPSPDPESSAVGAASLYRKYRPHSFASAELVGQDHIVRTLQNALALNRVAHAYLFSGPRGTGKTTTARLLAKAVNCLGADPRLRPCNTCVNCRAINAGSAPDVIEIDAASNRGIDDIRDLRERVRYAPAQLLTKVYIIDEAHQITGAAANAFLKTLEEPPAHSRFILATTDPEELLPTIVSRCQQFEFRRISADAIVRRMRTVADLESIQVDDDALRMMARHATGSLRDALGLLEQLSLNGDVQSGPKSASRSIDVATVRAVLGLSRSERIEGLVDALADHNAGGAIRIVQQALDDGEDPRQLNRQFVSYLRLLLLERSGGTSEADDRARALAARFSLAALAGHARKFSEIDFSIKHAPFPQLPLEVALVEATASASPEIGSAAPVAPVTPRNHAPVSSRPTMLRDRVRGQPAIRDAQVPDPAIPVHPELSPITPLRPAPVAEANEAKRTFGEASLDVEHVADLWPSVRADVKALNRRIEALLSEVDPVAISGNQITLAVPYPFHRDKLNSDEVRETVGGVLSRLLNRNISILCVLRGEMSGVGAAAAATAENSHANSSPESATTPGDVGQIASRMRAAMNIFDAEEVDASTVASTGNDGAVS